MKKNLIAIAGDQAFKITSVRDFQFIVVGRRNIENLLGMRDNFGPETVARLEAMFAKGEKTEFILDCWTTRKDLAEKKATALRNINHKGIPAYVDVQIVPVKQYFGPKS